jgi:hypothetical protein
MRKMLNLLPAFILLLGLFSTAMAFEKRVVLGENFGATW